MSRATTVVPPKFVGRLVHELTRWAHPPKHEYEFPTYDWSCKCGERFKTEAQAVMHLRSKGILGGR